MNRISGTHTFMLPVSVEVRERAGVAAGDQVDVDLELDTEPREVAVPPDLADALDRDLDVRRLGRPLLQRQAAAGAAGRAGQDRRDAAVRRH